MPGLPRELIGEFIDSAVRNPSRAIELLAAHPDLIDARWIHNETALHFLAIENFIDGVAFLAERGARIDATNEFGATALIEVCAMNNVPMVKLLLRYGANPNATSRTCDNLLHDAMRSGNPELVAALLDGGADTRIVTEWGESVFDVLEYLGPHRDDIAVVLAERGIHPEGE
jgi:ankyrin repeat protein